MFIEWLSMRYFILCLLSLTLFGADPPAKPLPAGVDPIVKEYQDAVAKARAAYEATCAKALDKALDKLDSKNKEIIKRGDVDGAIAVKAVIEKVKSGKVRDEAEKASGDLLGGVSAGSLYVCAGHNVEIIYKGKPIGKSSQWGPLIPIELNPSDGDEIYFHCTGEAKHTYGVSWLFVTGDKGQYMVSSIRNTLGKLSGEMTKDGVVLGQTGAGWVVGALTGRLPDDLKRFVPEAIEIVRKTQTEPPPTESIYVWTFKATDLKRR
jgi:hypothetical protein